MRVILTIAYNNDDDGNDDTIMIITINCYLLFIF